MQQIEYNLDIPQFDAKQGYLQSIFQSRQQLKQTLLVPEFGKEPMRLYFMIKIIIQDEIRDSVLVKQLIKQLDDNIDTKIKQLYLDRKKEREEYIKDCRDNGITVDSSRIRSIDDTETKRNTIILDEAINMIGEITKYNDKFLGIATENKVKISKIDCVNCPHKLNSLNLMKQSDKITEVFEEDIYETKEQPDI